MKALDLTCKVEEFIWLTPTVFQLSFSIEPKIQFIAGQFFSVVIPGAGPQGRDLRRAYSIASSPENPLLQLCVRKVEGGPGTTYLSQLKVGDFFKGQAPFGHFVYKSDSSKDVYFISTGTGISPFRSMLNSEAFLGRPPKSITCLFGSTDEKELIYKKDEFRTPELNFIIALSRASSEWSGFKGRVTHYIQSIEDRIQWNHSDFYLCGNGLMIDEMKAMLTQKGVKKESIFQEVYYKPKDLK